MTRVVAARAPVARNILAAANVEVLRQYAWSNVLVGLDFDGTLAPIVRDRDAAQMRARTRKLATEVARLYPCVVISGRSRMDLSRRLQGLGRMEAIGNHGLEPSRHAARFAAEVAGWLPELERRLRGRKGIAIENKVFSVALHYRQSRERKAARAAILDALSSFERIRVVGGKLVYNVLPADAPHKGLALLEARDRLGCDAALYIGDDDTDEDVFTLNQPGRLLSIRIGSNAASEAPYFVPQQRDIDAILQILIDCRKARRALAGNAGSRTRRSAAA